MEDKPISIRLGSRRLEALERYLQANPDETRNGVIAGAVEEYLRETGYWSPPDPTAKVTDDNAIMATSRPTLSERVRALEEFAARIEAKMN
jgi:hypothetical protein